MPEALFESAKSAASSLDRRGFLKSLGGGLVVLFAVDAGASGQESGSAGRGMGQKLPENVAAWLHIAPDGKIEGFKGKDRGYQNIRPTLSQAVAKEIRCPLS